MNQRDPVICEPLRTPAGRRGKPDTVITRDKHPRADTALEGLAELRPIMAKADEAATVTAGNAGGQNDGAAACIVTTRATAEQLGTSRPPASSPPRPAPCTWLAQRIITAPGENAGLFVTNFPAAGFLFYEKPRALRKDLICRRVIGWADGRQAVDYTVNAAVGLPLVTGPTDAAGPVNHVLPAWDLLADTLGLSSGEIGRLHDQGLVGSP